MSNPLDMSDATYDKVKNLVTIVLPALGTAYFALDGIWGLPAAEQVVGTLAVIATFLGVSLRISNDRYEANYKQYGGLIQTFPDLKDGKTLYKLIYDGDIEELQYEDEILFKVAPLNADPDEEVPPEEPS